MVHCMAEKFSMRTRNIGANPFQGQPCKLKVPGDYCRKSSLFIFFFFFVVVVVTPPSWRGYIFTAVYFWYNIQQHKIH